MSSPLKILSAVLFFSSSFVPGLAAKTITNEAAEQYTSPGFDWLMHEDILRDQMNQSQSGEPGALALVAKAMREGDPRAGLALQNYLKRYPADPVAYDLAGTQLLNDSRPREAAVAFKRALELNPASSLTRAKYGAALALQGQMKAASQILRDAVVQDPQNALALHWLQRIAITQGDVDTATRYAERSLNAFGLPETHVNRAHLDLADLYMVENRWSDVMDLLSPVLRVEQLDVPDSFAAEVYGRLTQAATEVEDPVTSRLAFERARDLLAPEALRNLPWPLLEARILRLEGEASQSLALLEALVEGNSQARRALAGEIAEAKAASGATEEALADLLDIIRTQPDGETAQLATLYGDIAAQAGWPDGSAEALLAAMSPDESTSVMLESARVELQTGQTQSARAKLGALVATEGTATDTRIEAHRLLAGIAYAEGDGEQARNEIRAALALSPASEELWLTLAAYTHDPGTHMHSGNTSAGHDELRAVMLEASEALPESPAIWAELGIIDFTEGKTETAAEFFLQSLKLSPARPQINVLAALALVDSGGDLDVAQSLAEFAARVNPDRPEVLDALGWITARKHGDMDRALEYLEEAAARAPDDATILRHRAEVLQALGRPGDAARDALDALGGELAKHDRQAARDLLLTTTPRESVEVAFRKLAPDGGLGETIGAAILSPDGEGLTVRVTVSGMPPGMHEIHIHELPNCGPGPDGKPGEAAGPHFGHTGHHVMMSGNNMAHSMENMQVAADAMEPQVDNASPMGPYRGDLPHLMADADGKVTATLDVDWLNLDEIRGRSLMLHEGMSTPSSGPPKYACGVIG